MMRTLIQEISYQQENGFNGNTISLRTLLSWLGELTALEYEIRVTREKNQNLRFANSDLLNAIDKKERDLQLMEERVRELMMPNAKKVAEIAWRAALEDAANKFDGTTAYNFTAADGYTNAFDIASELRYMATETPNDRVEGRDAALSRRVTSHDGLGVKT